MKKGFTLNAVATRNFLAFFMVLVVLGATAGFYFGLQIIKDYAVEVSHAVADSNASGKSIEQLSVLKQELAEREPLVAKASQLFSNESNYQAQGLKDIQKYASITGVTITNTDFSKSDTTTAPATLGGTAVITIQSPVSYAKLLAFIDALEGNLPKLQITGINISRPTAASGDLVTTDKITITVAIR